MKERELLISQVNKQKNENSASEHKAEIAAKTRENKAELTKKSNELEDLQNKIHKYEAEMEKKTKESEDQLAEKTKEIKELQEKIHKYEDEIEKKTKEFENELNKKSNEIKELKDIMHELIENHDKEIQNIRNEFQNHQPVNTSNDKSIKKANNKIDSEKVSENPEKVNESLEKVDDSVNKANEENFFFGIDDEAHFETIKKLGEGMTSVVYKIIDNRTKVPLCKKVLKVEGATFKDLQNAVKEFHLLHCLRHPCICYAIAINTSEIYTEETETSDEVTTVALLLEFVDFNLKECLANNILNNTLKTRIVVEISHAMRYLHANGLIYRDLKIDNIMLNSVFQVKMIDFGLARINECLFGEEMMNTISLTKGVGNAHFMSPEMMKEEDYDNKTDVFSFGIVLYVIFFGNLPKQTMKEKAMGKAINIPEESSSISKCCIELMKICIADDPKERPSFEEILEFLRKCKFMLSPDVDPSIVEQRDKELEYFKFKNNNE
ncbi:hypothetical protein M9Y10_037761 [Tritrichomonas musculus]|uniref:mitogen-activated protein kinase kinase n=1 Tax=Tritrichomonas musculus TaxID=1915356 RepID=A0ABR2GRH3_9EUKA